MRPNTIESQSRFRTFAEGVAAQTSKYILMPSQETSFQSLEKRETAAERITAQLRKLQQSLSRQQDSAEWVTAQLLKRLVVLPDQLYIANMTTQEKTDLEPVMTPEQIAQKDQAFYERINNLVSYKRSHEVDETGLILSFQDQPGLAVLASPNLDRNTLHTAELLKKLAHAFPKIRIYDDKSLKMIAAGKSDVYDIPLIIVPLNAYSDLQVLRFIQNFKCPQKDDSTYIAEMDVKGHLQRVAPELQANFQLAQELVAVEAVS